MCVSPCNSSRIFFFFFNDTATTEIYTLSLHDALPILHGGGDRRGGGAGETSGHGLSDARHGRFPRAGGIRWGDRKSTRLNSSHSQISYAVFCLKKKNKESLPRPPATRTRRKTHYSAHT